MDREGQNLPGTRLQRSQPLGASARGRAFDTETAGGSLLLQEMRRIRDRVKGL